MVCGLEGGDGGGFGCYGFLFGLRFLFSVKSEGPARGRAVSISSMRSLCFSSISREEMDVTEMPDSRRLSSARLKRRALKQDGSRFAPCPFVRLNNEAA
jgi:hypothetical protein